MSLNRSEEGFSSDSSTNEEIVRKGKNRIQHIFIDCLDSSPKVMKILLPLFETIFLIMFVGISISPSFQHGEILESILRYSQIVANPFSLQCSLIIVHIVRALSLVIIAGYDILFMYVFFKEGYEKWVTFLLYIATKAIGIVLFFPLLRIFSSVFRVDFSTGRDSVTSYDFFGYENVIQLILYVPAIINLIGIGIINWMFMYKRFGTFTDTIEGRFNTLRLILVFLVVFLTELFYENDSFRVSVPIVNAIVCFLLFAVHVRFLPYLSKVWNVIVPLFYCIGFCGSIYSFFIEIFPFEYWPALALLLLLVALPLTFAAVVIRICLIYVFYYRKIKNETSKIIKRSCLGAWDSYDFAVICHFTKRFEDFGSSIEKYFPNSHRAHLYFIDLVISKESSYIYKCATLLNKIEKYTTKSKCGSFSLDVNFRKHRLEKVVKGLQETGFSGSSLFEKEMRVVSKREKKLRSYFKVFWRGLLANEEKSIDFGIYPSLVSQIEVKLTELNKIYETLLKKYGDDSDFLRKYGTFKCIMNDERTGRLFLDLAANKQAQDSKMKDNELEHQSLPAERSDSVHGRKSSEENEEQEGEEEDGLGCVQDKTETSSDSNVDSDDEFSSRRTEARINLIKTSAVPNIDGGSSNSDAVILDSHYSNSTYGFEANEANEEIVSCGGDENNNDLSSEIQVRKKKLERQLTHPTEISTTNNVIQGVMKKYGPALSSHLSYGGTSHQSSSVARHVSFLLRKIRRTSYLSVNFLRILNCCTLFILLTFSIFLIVIYFLMDSHFAHKSLIVNDISHVETDVSTIKHLLRKIDLVENPKTLFFFDQDKGDFDRKLVRTIDRVLTSLLLAYDHTNSGTKHLWSDVTVSFDHYVDYLNDSHVHTNTLLDALTIYSKRSENLMNLPPNTTMSECSDFTYVLLAEPSIQEGIQEFKTLLLSDDDLIRNIYLYSLIVMLGSGLMVLMVYFCLYCCMRYQFRKLVKSFALIPKESVVGMYSMFEKEQLSIFYNISNNKSILETFFLRIGLFVVAVVIIFCTIDGLCINVCSIYSQRNNEVILCSELTGDIRQVDSLAVDLLYSEDDMSEKLTFQKTLGNKIHSLKSAYEALRFGGSDEYDVPGSDARFYSSFHDKACEIDSTTTTSDSNNTMTQSSVLETRIEELECNSLNWLFNMYLQYAHMMELYFDTLTLDHEWYADFTLLDLYGGNDGVLVSRLTGMTGKYKEYNQELLDILKVVFLSVLFGSLPLVTIVMCCCLFPFSLRIKKTFNRVKLIFLSIPNEELMANKHVLEFLSSRSNGGGTKKFFKKKNGSMRMEVYESFDNSSLLFFVLDMSGRVLRFNNNASKVFNLKEDEEMIHKFSQFVGDQDMKTIDDFITSGENSFNGEVMMSSFTHHFPVHIDLFRTNNKKTAKYHVLIRNLEEIRRDEDDKLRKQKSEDIGRLVKCIIPSELFSNLDVEDQTAEYIFQNLSKEYIGVCKESTPIFSDIVNFTGFSSQNSPEKIIRILNVIYSKFDEMCDFVGLEKIKTIGDCYFAIAGVPTYVEKHALLAAEFALAQLGWMEVFRESTKIDLHLRVGLSSGPVVSGILGRIKLNFDVFGDTVNCASRMADKSLVDKIQVSQMTYDHLRDKYDFFERTLDLQGKGVTKAYVLTKRKERTNVIYKVESQEEFDVSFFEACDGDENSYFTPPTTFGPKKLSEEDEEQEQEDEGQKIPVLGKEIFPGKISKPSLMKEEEEEEVIAEERKNLEGVITPCSNKVTFLKIEDVDESNNNKNKEKSVEKEKEEKEASSCELVEEEKNKKDESDFLEIVDPVE